MARRHDALIPLSHDHRAALALVFRLQHPAPPGPVTATTPVSTPESRRNDVLAFYRDSLVEHFSIEEEILFPVIRNAYVETEKEHALVDELMAEHRELHECHAKLKAALPGRSLDDALSRFASQLESHVRREERELFAAFPGRLGESAVAGLLESIHRRRPPDGVR